MDSNTTKWIVIVGPTASGKTDLSLQLARRLYCPIVSFDSRQCFRELNAGVSKPTNDELQEVKHYFINSHSIRDSLSLIGYRDYVQHLLRHELSQVKTIVLVGGTGFYLDALIYGVHGVPKVSADLLMHLQSEYEKKGIPWLQDELATHDKEYILQFKEPNPHRWLRALAVKIETQKSILDFWKQEPLSPLINKENIFLVALKTKRDLLYERINNRVIKMMEAGLLDEAENLLLFKQNTALQTIGYKECFSYLENKILSIEELTKKIQQHTRQYAKRQITWMKKYSAHVIFENGSHVESILDKVP